MFSERHTTNVSSSVRGAHSDLLVVAGVALLVLGGDGGDFAGPPGELRVVRARVATRVGRAVQEAARVPVHHGQQGRC